MVAAETQGAGEAMGLGSAFISERWNIKEAATLSEAARVLKPGGRVVTVPTITLDALAGQFGLDRIDFIKHERVGTFLRLVVRFSRTGADRPRAADRASHGLL